MPSALSRLVLLVALAVAGCGGGPIFDQVSATLPPVPAGEARIFVYRDYEPYQSLSWVPVFFNGATIGAVGPGHVLMRDVPPGTYKIEPKSEGLWPDQAKTVRVAAGDLSLRKSSPSTASTTLAPATCRPRSSLRSWTRSPRAARSARCGMMCVSPQVGR